MTCEEVEALLPEYAMNALDESERMAVAARLDDCPGCREQLASYEAIGLDLARNVPKHPAPIGLRDILMRAATADAKRHAPEGQLAKLGRWLRTPMLSPRLTLATLAIMAAAGFGLWNRVTSTVPTPAVIAQQVAAHSAVTTKLNPVGPGQASNAWASMKYNPENSVAALVVGDLPPVPEGQVFQLWLVDANGKRASGAVFAGGKELQTVLVNAPLPLKAYVRFGISVEPSGGSPGPTGPGVLRSS